MQEKSLSRRAGKVFIRSHLTLLQGKTFTQTEPLNCTLEDMSIQLLSMLTAKSRQRQKIENKPSSFYSWLTLPKKKWGGCVFCWGCNAISWSRWTTIFVAFHKTSKFSGNIFVAFLSEQLMPEKQNKYSWRYSNHPMISYTWNEAYFFWETKRIFFNGIIWSLMGWDKYGWVNWLMGSRYAM